MRLDDKEIMLLWEQGVLRSSRSTPTKKRELKNPLFFILQEQ